ncbi:MAG TPA: formyltetrahydrofolate deformylase [Acidimicrobiales bacterium]|nr:formyltetrahydrofolate deformylase [Acidimicrobiales bacterium]
MQRFILTLRCSDRAGIVLAAAKGIVEAQGNIVESDQFSDPPTGLFCMRISFDSPRNLDEVRGAIDPYLTEFEPMLGVRPESQRRRVLVMVSKIDHCLVDLLYRWNIGELPVDIPLIVSNHPDCAPIAERYGITFHHLPVTPRSKSVAEASLRELVDQNGVDFIVLARYMQVLSAEFCATLPGNIINIHHSFLPGFKGAKPYHQAYERGVKLIGATAHYVTDALDEGPIIEQGVIRVTHAQSASDLVAMGRDIERTVLARAVRLQAEDRVVLAGNRALVFSI